MNYNEKFKEQYQRFLQNVRKLGYKNVFDWAKSASELNLLSKSDNAAVESTTYLNEVLDSEFSSSVSISSETYSLMCNLVKLSTIFTMRPSRIHRLPNYLDKRQYKSNYIS